MFDTLVSRVHLIYASSWNAKCDSYLWFWIWYALFLCPTKNRTKNSRKPICMNEKKWNEQIKIENKSLRVKCILEMVEWVFVSCAFFYTWFIVYVCSVVWECAWVTQCIIKSMLGQEVRAGPKIYTCLSEKQRAEAISYISHAMQTYHVWCLKINVQLDEWINLSEYWMNEGKCKWSVYEWERERETARMQQSSNSMLKMNERNARRKMDQYLKASTCEWYVVQWNDGYLKIACNIMQIHQMYVCVFEWSEWVVYMCVCCCWVLFEYLTVKLIMQSTCELK